MQNMELFTICFLKTFMKEDASLNPVFTAISETETMFGDVYITVN